MAKNIHFVVDDDEYERLDRIKNEHGLTWRGMVKHAANDLETPAGE
ncbi:hypothetical protein [Natronorubrum halophilum]|nr:hypothetical protein [Natronorubrum halophilum]